MFILSILQCSQTPYNLLKQFRDLNLKAGDIYIYMYNNHCALNSEELRLTKLQGREGKFRDSSTGVTE